MSVPVAFELYYMIALKYHINQLSFPFDYIYPDTKTLCHIPLGLFIARLNNKILKPS